MTCLEMLSRFHPIDLEDLCLMVASIKDAYMVTSLNISHLQSHHVRDTIASHGNQSAVLLDATDHNEYIKYI